MNHKLDVLIGAAKAEPPPAAYNSIEQRVWGEIESVRNTRRAAPIVFAARACGVVGALVLGIAGGGMTAVAVAREAQEISAFSIKTEIAPSTLLDHHG